MDVRTLTLSQIATRPQLLSLYEKYYLELDPKNSGSISAQDGASFLKKSGLSDVILGKIWDLADYNSTASLDKKGLFISLKLVTLAQNGRDVTANNITADITEEPKIVGMTFTQTATSQVPAQASAPRVATILSEESIEKYHNLYKGLVQDTTVDGKIPGAKAKQLMLESGLPVETLGKIWDLADVDKDGALDKVEFITALHLVHSCRQQPGVVLPNAVPQELITCIRNGVGLGSMVSGTGVSPNYTAAVAPILPPAPSSPAVVSTSPVPKAMQQSSRSSSVSSGIGVGSVPPGNLPKSTSLQSTNSLSMAPAAPDGWIVSLEDREKYGRLFTQTDQDADGFVSGMEIKDVFLKSGVPQSILAHIWNLCDTSQQGKLTQDQFILAMWLLHRKAVKGIDPPVSLSPEMMPSAKGTNPPSALAAGSGDATAAALNPEFEIIQREINELLNEKNNLECEILSKESEKKVKSGEVKSLQSELDTLAATLKQLENQKNVASNRLSDLETQVNNLRTQAETQESSLITQELELSQKSQELQSLDLESQRVEQEQKQVQIKIDRLNEMQQETQLQIKKVQTQLTDLQELENTMQSCLLKYNECIENGNVYSITESELRDITTEMDELISAISGPPPTTLEPSAAKDDFKQSSLANSSSYHSDVGDASWGNYDSSRYNGTHLGDNFSNSGFSTAFNDPFGGGSANKDPFGGPANATSPWGGSSAGASPNREKDPFGTEPFAVEEEAPALPPKKPPPPRPAPPKNAPARPPPPSFAKKASSSSASPVGTIKSSSASDPFGGDPFGGGSNFADFSQFEQSSYSKSASPWIPVGTFGASSSSNTSRTSSNKDKIASALSNMDFTEDPFKNYSYEEAFNMDDPFSSPSKGHSKASVVTSGLNDLNLGSSGGRKDYFHTEKRHTTSSSNNNNNDNNYYSSNNMNNNNSVNDSYSPGNSSSRTHGKGHHINNQMFSVSHNDRTNNDNDPLHSSRFSNLFGSAASHQMSSSNGTRSSSSSKIGSNNSNNNSNKGSFHSLKAVSKNRK